METLLNRRVKLRERLRSNPVVLKELRSRMRGGRAFWVLTAYLLLLSGGIGLIFLGFVVSENSGSGPEVRQAMGKAVFGLVVGLELLTVSFIAPALTAGAISSEREQLTYDIVRTTLLSARSLVFGKLLSALSYVILLLFAAFPLQSLAFLFGGVATAEVLIAALLLAVTALAFCSVGLFFSSFTRRTLVSTVLSYAFAILLVFGLPMLLTTGVAMFQSLFSGTQSQPSLLMEAVLVLAGLMFVSINPVATAIVTEILLVEEQAVFYFAFPLSGGNTFPIISPWITFTFFYLLLSALLIWLSIRFVRRVER
jgi:ABC-type transport system involved in multi-copper enzyme maturation permease subunit